MVKLRNSCPGLTLFVLSLTLLLLGSCHRKFAVSKIEGFQITITNALQEDKQIDLFISPYRNHVESEMNTVLAYSPQNLDRAQGKWQSALGNLMADVCLDAASDIIMKRYGVRADMCLLNYGGIRSVIPKGDVTVRTAYELMPFENMLVVAKLKGAQVAQMVTFLLAEKKAHPLSGLSLSLTGSTATDIKINGRPLNHADTYLVVTSDYLLNGGDNMLFFGQASEVYETDYKIRNALIDYFKKVDTLDIRNDTRISVK